MKKISILLMILIVMSYTYCSVDIPNDPKPPKWYVTVEKIPLLKADTLRIGDELEAEDFNRSADDDSVLSVAIDSSQSFDIGDKLQISSQHKKFSDEIGEFKIKSTRSFNYDIEFIELFPDLEGFVGSGVEVIVPAAQMPTLKKGANFEDDFFTVSIVSGGFELEIYNHLGIVLGDAVYLDLIDLSASGADTIISRVDLGRLEHGATGTYFIDLGGKTITNNLQVKVHGSLVGSEGESVTIPANSGFTIRVSPKDLVANQASAKLPEQTFEFEGNFDVNVDSSLVVKTAKVESGSITLTAENQFEFNIRVDVTIPNLTRPNNQPVTLTFYIPGADSRTSVISLDRTELDLDEKDLYFETIMTISPEADEYYTLSSGDELSLDVSISKIQLEEVVADFDMKTELPQIKEKVFKDPPDELDNLTFNDAIVNLSILNSPFEELDLDITFLALKDKDSDSLVINKTLSQDESLVLDKNGVNNDYSSPTIVDILNLIPEKMIIDGDVQVRGKDVLFRKDDELIVDYTVELPLEFALSNASYTDADTLKLKEKSRKKIRDYLVSADVELTVENKIPLGGNLRFLVGEDSLHIDNTIVSVELPVPEKDNLGMVITPASSTISVSLDSTRFNQLADAYFFKFAVQLFDTDAAKLTANDYIIVRDVFVTGKALVDPDGLADDDDDEEDDE